MGHPERPGCEGAGCPRWKVNGGSRSLFGRMHPARWDTRHAIDPIFSSFFDRRQEAG
jgi:hypothetical protein